MPTPNLATAVRAFAEAALRLSDADLDAPWGGPQPADEWQAPFEDHRELCFRVYLQLRALAVDTLALRTTAGVPFTTAQRALAQHQVAYRAFQGALLGVADEELDIAPGAEWALRTVIAHVVRAERGYLARIAHAVDQQHAGVEVTETPAADFEQYGTLSDAGSLEAVLNRYDELHRRVIGTLTSLTDAEVNAVSFWWAEQRVVVRFRLHRLDVHLREHTIQVEKTLALINHHRDESDRLAALLYEALGEAEGACIGAEATNAAARQRLAVVIQEMAEALANE